MQDSLADVAKRPVESYIVAHDLMSGAERWKTLRMTGAHAESCDSYTTPLLAQIDGQTQMIVMGADQLDAYDPDSGRQIWLLPKIHGARTVTGPTVADGMVFVTLGNKGALLAVKPRGHGELPRQSIVWQYKEGTPDTCCPVAWGDHLFIVSDAGIARCLDIHTGRALWTERLKGEYKASPVAAEGRIYFLNSHGLCTVISASERFDKLAENQLDDDTLASPVISDGHIFIRGRKAIYCLGRDF
jgi:outer membrane protein assembly factor BamB